jgi:hypothetical protein
MSSKWNDKFIEKHFTQNKDCAKLVLATLFISVWKLQSVKDTSGKVIGTKVTYVYNATAGGSIPTFLQNKVAPKTALDTIQGAVNFLRKKKGLKKL